LHAARFGVSWTKKERITGLTRRIFILLFISWLAALPPGAPAWAKDGESGGGSNSGSGSSNSGSGNGGDDGSDDGGDGNDDSGVDNSGSGSHSSGKYLDQYGAREAVTSGSAMPLEEALKKLRARYPGKVIAVSMGHAESRLCYWFKVKSGDGNVRKIVMDAKTGKFRGLFGFGGS
jgi:hypothetical protein